MEEAKLDLDDGDDDDDDDPVEKNKREWSGNKREVKSVWWNQIYGSMDLELKMEIGVSCFVLFAFSLPSKMWKICCCFDDID